MKERLIICIVLFVIAYAVCGCEEAPTSEYAWPNSDLTELIWVLCRKQGVEESGRWRITCPKCKKDGKLLQYPSLEYPYDDRVANVYLIKTKKPSKLLCASCRYPVGIDWKITNLSEQGIGTMNNGVDSCIKDPDYIGNRRACASAQINKCDWYYCIAHPLNDFITFEDDDFGIDVNDAGWHFLAIPDIGIYEEPVMYIDGEPIVKN